MQSGTDPILIPNKNVVSMLYTVPKSRSAFLLLGNRNP